MSNEIPPDGYGSEDAKFIPMADYEVLKEQMFQEREGKLRALDERDQLREALGKVNAGIHKASDMAEGVIETYDQKIITDLAFMLLKQHPKKLSIRYKGSEWKEIYHE
jgi:hypothetical protein